MIRLRGISSVVFTGMLIALAMCLVGCGKKETGQPNVMLIILDTTRADALSCYGWEDGQTDRMDELSRRGMIFEDAVSHNPFTLGSIATILSSLEPDLHGIKGNTGYRLAPGAETLAEVFRANGYATAAFVSASVVDGETGLEQGFDIYDDDFSMLYPIYDSQYLPLQEERMGTERRGDETVRRSVKWLEEDRPLDRSFFLLVHLFDPHQPYDPPPPFQKRFLSMPYAGEVAFSDSLVGVLLDALEDQGLEKSTVVSLVGDHGEAFREHNEVTHGFLLYETTLRVPWILAGPGVPKGRAVGPVGLVDVAPTLLASCGIPLPPSLQGESLLDEVRPGGGAVRLETSGIYQETYFPRITHNWSELIGWRKGPWKYIRGPRSELFNLDSDPDETVNLLETEKARAEELSRELDAYLKRESPYRITDAVTTPDKEKLEKLRSLGYVGGGPDSEIEGAGWDIGLPDPKDAIIPWNRKQEAMAFYRVALSSFHAGDFGESLRWADKAIQADSTHYDALFLRCRSLAAQERHAEAVRHFGSLLALRPDDVAAWNGMGISLDKLGQWQKAMRAFETAVSIDADSPEANYNLGSLLARRGRLEDVVPYYERVRELVPDDVPLKADLARIYLQLKQTDRASEVLQEAYAVDPKNPGTLLLLGRLHIEKGDVSKGREVLREFLKQHPRRPEAGDVRRLLESLEEG